MRLNRRVGAWAIIDIFNIEQINSELVRIIGPIVNSNFLSPTDCAEMPVLSHGIANAFIGDRIKLVFFTTQEALDAFRAEKSMGFIDSGLCYYKWEDEGWSLIYHGD